MSKEMLMSQTAKSTWRAMLLWAVTFGATLATPYVLAQTQGFSVALVPPSPTALQPVVARITVPTNCSLDPSTLRLAQVAGAGNAFQITILPPPNCIPFPTPLTYDVGLGTFPAGQYVVKLVYSETEVSSITFNVSDNSQHASGRIFPLVNYADAWWSEQESGWGLFITQHTSDQLFAGWFVYAADGRPTWYTLQPGSWTRFDTFAGPIYKTTGPYFGGPFDPANVVRTIAGNGTLTFHSSGSATFSYSADGIAATKEITRLPF